MNTFRCNLSHAFHNKTNLTGQRSAFSSSFIPTEVTLQELIHLATVEGKAFTMACFKSNRRTRAFFETAQIIGLDVDNKVPLLDEHGKPVKDQDGEPIEVRRVNDYIAFDEAACNPFIQANAAFMYHTPSSTPEWNRFRIIFILSEPVTEYPRWEAIQRGIIRRFADWNPDPSCKDAARLWFGSDKPGALVFDRTLAIEDAGALTIDDAIEDMLAEFVHRDAKFTPIDPGSDLARRVIAKTMETSFHKIATEGGSRWGNCYKYTAFLCSLMKGGAPTTYSEIEDGSMDACRSNGALKKYGEVEIKRCIRDAHDAATPRAFELPEKKSTQRRRANEAARQAVAQRVKSVDLPTFTADLTVDMRYISGIPITEFAGATAINIKSALATGKTELIPRIIDHARKRLKREPTVLYITNRAALVESTAKRLHLLSYTEFVDIGIDIKSAPQLAITVDSLWRVAGNQYDVVVIDETTQVHQHLDGSTMRGGEHRRAYTTLKALAQTAGRVYGLDAQNTDTATRWLGQISDGLVLAVENKYQPHTGETFTMLSDKTLAYEHAARLMGENAGAVYIACSSKAESELMVAYLQRLYPDKAGILINSDNSHSDEIQRFILNMNEELPRLAYLVTSPSLSTGIDITAPLRAVIGILGRPNAPAEMMQMMHRCRNAGERLAYVQGTTGDAETDWHTIYHIADDNAHTTAVLAEFGAHGISTGDAHLRGANRLLSEYRATRNRALNDPLSHFVALAQAEGYSITYQDGEHKSIRAALRNIRQELQAARQQLVLESTPISYDDLQLHRLNKTITPEIRAGHERFKIEDTAGLTISPELYERWRTSAMRLRFKQGTNMFDTLENLKDLDRGEAVEGKLYSKRGHHTARRLFIERVIRGVFDCSFNELPDLAIDISAADLDAKTQDLAARFEYDLIHLFGWRPGAHSPHGIPLLRWILAQVGVKLGSRQVMQSGQRFMLYGIDPAQWAEFNRLATARLAHLARKRAERLAQPGITKNLLIRVNQDFSNRNGTQQNLPPAPPESEVGPFLIERLAILRAF